jgi:hypothetical protein
MKALGYIVWAFALLAVAIIVFVPGIVGLLMSTIWGPAGARASNASNISNMTKNLDKA